MKIEINWLAVTLATVVGMVCAGTWYSKALFGPIWRRLTGISEADSQKAGNKPMAITFVANIITAIVLAALINTGNSVFEHNSVGVALFAGFALWAAFSATTLATHNAFELKPTKLTWINNGYQLVLFLSMALVIGLFD